MLYNNESFFYHKLNRELFVIFYFCTPRSQLNGYLSIFESFS